MMIAIGGPGRAPHVPGGRHQLSRRPSMPARSGGRSEAGEAETHRLVVAIASLGARPLVVGVVGHGCSIGVICLGDACRVSKWCSGRSRGSRSALAIRSVWVAGKWWAAAWCCFFATNKQTTGRKMEVGKRRATGCWAGLTSVSQCWEQWLLVITGLLLGWAGPVFLARLPLLGSCFALVACFLHSRPSRGRVEMLAPTNAG